MGSPGNRYPPGEIASLEQQDPLWLYSKEPEILEGTESLNVADNKHGDGSNAEISHDERMQKN